MSMCHSLLSRKLNLGILLPYLFPLQQSGSLRNKLSLHTLLGTCSNTFPWIFFFQRSLLCFIPTGLALPPVLTFEEQGEGAAIFSLRLKSAGSKNSDAACGALESYSHSLSLSLPICSMGMIIALISLTVFVGIKWDPYVNHLTSYLDLSKCSKILMITVISKLHYSVPVIYREEFSQILDLGCNRQHLLIVQMGKMKQRI